MKILKIEFQNINSLRGIHNIDFTTAPFTTSSLFAITGPTGSGKSTILDVISLALFNQVPRLGKISRKEIEEKGALLTRNQKEAFATVTYQCKSGEYASTWSISTARTGNLRDYEMQLSNIATGDLLDLKKSDVPAKNEDLIGLNYNQFIKSVLLAQGDFAQFLRAKKEERGELLEKITGTGIYRQLGIKAFEKCKEVSSGVKIQQDRISAISEELLDVDKVTSFSKELIEKEKKCKTAEVTVKKTSRHLEIKENIRKHLGDIGEVESKKLAAENSLEKFKAQHGTELKLHEKLQNYAEDLRSWSRQKEELTDLYNQKTAKKEKIERILEELKDCLNSTGKFIGAEVTSENITQELENFSKKVHELQQKKYERSSEYINLKGQLQRELEEVEFDLEEKVPDQSFKKLKDLESAFKVNVQIFKAGLNGINFETPEDEKKRLNKNLEIASLAKQSFDKISQLTEGLETLQKEEEKIAPNLLHLPKEIENAKTKIEFLKERLEKLNLAKENQLLIASVKELRAKLTEGEPCPLCGSKEHPFAEHLPAQDSELQKKIAETEKEFKDWSSKFSSNQTSLKHFQERETEIQKQKQVLQKELKNKQLDFSEKFPKFSENLEINWEDYFKSVRQQIQKLEEFQKENSKLRSIQLAVPIHLQLNKVLKEGLEIKSSLEKLYSGKEIHRDCNQFHQKWTVLTQENSGLTNQLEELEHKTEKQTEAFKTSESNLTSTVRENGFDSITEARKALLPDSLYHQLRTEREKIHQNVNIHIHSLKLLNDQLTEIRKGDVEITAEELKENLYRLQEDLETTTRECEQLRWALKNDEDRRVQLKKLKEGIAESEKRNKRWKLLDELIGDSKGKKFNDFAQDLSLTQLLLHANLRLKDLSDRYTIDKPTETEDDGLVAIDQHMGGQRRSVKTLSGGETFILSLSMALALSDLASRSVEINSLFIDEGFGTLDPETLDQTLDTLEKLQAESSKTIGIISHVDSLKERIATQIQLKRHGQGYSTLEISG